MNEKKKKYKILLPFVHYRLEIPELVQGALMIAVGLSTVPVLQETLGLSYTAALTAVAIAEALGLLHVLFGDPVVPGWIASALSLVLVYLGGYAVGIESIHALMALQILVSLIFIILGVTGMAHKLISIVPSSIKAGVLLGAAIAALARVVGEGGYLSQYPISVVSGSIVALFVLFSVAFKKMKDRRRAYREIAKYGMLSSLIVAMAVGFASGELALPKIEWGFIPFSFKELFQSASVFAVGLPSIKSFFRALPVALAVYIIAFGEIITEESVLKECQEARPEDNLDFDTNRTNIIAGVRNLILALFCPFTALAGPMWAAVTVSIGERYKEGKKSMHSLIGGMGSFKLSTAVCVLLMPLASLLTPILPVALAVTLVVQCFACAYIAIDQIKGDRTAEGTAVLMGSTVYLANLNWALVVGILSYLLLEGRIIKIFEKKTIRINERKLIKMKKDNMIITIEQEYCGNGSEIAAELAQALDIPCYDEHILHNAAEISGIPLKLFKRYEGRSVTAAYDLTAEDESQIKLPQEAQFVAALTEASKALAENGPCILVDGHSHRALAGNRDCLNIFIHASAEHRLKKLHANDPDATLAEIKKADKKRRKYYRGYDKTWGEVGGYNIAIDATAMDDEAIVQQILLYINTALAFPEGNVEAGQERGA